MSINALRVLGLGVVASVAGLAQADYILDVPTTSNVTPKIVRNVVSWMFRDVDATRPGVQVNVWTGIENGRLTFYTDSTTDSYGLPQGTVAFSHADLANATISYKFAGAGALFFRLNTAAGARVVSPVFQAGTDEPAAIIETQPLAAPAVNTSTVDKHAEGWTYGDVDFKNDGKQVYVWGELSGYQLRFRTDSTSAGVKTINTLPGLTMNVGDAFSYNGRTYVYVTYFTPSWEYRSAIISPNFAGGDPLEFSPQL